MPSVQASEELLYDSRYKLLADRESYKIIMGSPIGLPINHIYAMLLLANLDSKYISDKIVKNIEREDKQWDE